MQGGVERVGGAGPCVVASESACRTRRMPKRRAQARRTKVLDEAESVIERGLERGAVGRVTFYGLVQAQQSAARTHGCVQVSGSQRPQSDDDRGSRERSVGPRAQERRCVPVCVQQAV